VVEEEELVNSAVGKPSEVCFWWGRFDDAAWCEEGRANDDENDEDRGRRSMRRETGAKAEEL